jgi:hypothetical protein
MTRTSVWIRSRLFLTATVSFLAAGCDLTGSTVPVSTGDVSPPTVAGPETLGRQGGELAVTPTSGAVTGSWSGTESIVIAARAEDPEGVKEVAIWGTTQKTCTDAGGTATNEGPGSATVQLAVSTDPATPGGTAQSARQVQLVVKAADFRCPAGTVSLAVKQEFWVTGRNFGGGETKSDKLTLTHARP